VKPRRPTRCHPQIHLPPLDAGYALTLVDIFERAISAIWRAHGARTAELLELRVAARRTPEPELLLTASPRHRARRGGNRRPL
jgi:hypothetical protein